ncbi:MAG TPA: glycosyltransferase, partial [Gemmatimonadaceae bacterium]|nr:glycosyltransferase [Gemmatimonadaceae bacterium]
DPGDGVRRVALARVRWRDYDVVETNFHQGWDTLVRYGGTSHPFIIAKLGSVVGAHDMPGIYFQGAERERMLETQRAIHRHARYVTLLSPPARALWTELFGERTGILVVPGAAASRIPAKANDPYPPRDGIRVLFAGNIYNAQPGANAILVAKLNALGQRLAPHGRLYFAGPGDTRQLDARVVTKVGVVSYENAWQYMLHADVGVVVSPGPFMHNNESTKIYHYLRAGLPTVSEAGFPNDHVVREAGLGSVVANGDVDAMADRVLDAAHAAWDREAAVRYILAHHTWESRMAAYDDVLRQAFPPPRVGDAPARGRG